MNYYNEWDKGAAAWLRELIKQGHIPYGYVDERSIADVTPSDLEGFTQCHFFAGIGGWPYALRLAGIPDTTPLWTGSPPCQPFSVAGKQLGQLDERHLAPTFMRLVEQCKPPILFGEQVAAAIGKHWLDDLFTELERQGYACGSAVLPACSVGAPHKRDRLFFGAVNELADTNNNRQPTGSRGGKSCRNVSRDDVGRRGEIGSMADTNDPGSQGRKGMPECSAKQLAGPCGTAGCMADSCYGSGQSGKPRSNEWGLSQGVEENAAVWSNQDNGFWSGADWLGCRDGKFRPVESGTFPLASGVSARVGRLRGYGNAIVPQVAAEFIKAFMGSIGQ